MEGVRIKNVARGEAVSRLVIGVIFVILSFFVSGVFKWILGLTGVAVLLTAFFGY
jgi:hypothetical protein